MDASDVAVRGFARGVRDEGEQGQSFQVKKTLTERLDWFRRRDRSRLCRRFPRRERGASGRNDFRPDARGWVAAEPAARKRACLLLDRIKREKGVWWMPWQQEAMKDVALCDKPGGGESTL